MKARPPNWKAGLWSWWHLVRGTWYLVLGTWYLVLGAMGPSAARRGELIPRPTYHVPRTTYHALRTTHRYQQVTFPSSTRLGSCASTSPRNIPHRVLLPSLVTMALQPSALAKS